MWVWYCRPPIGAHFHPTRQPPPVPQQLGEKAHLRTVAVVLANATAPACRGRRRAGPRGRRRPAGRHRIHDFMTDAAGCEPHRPSSRHWRRRLVQATTLRRSGERSHSFSVMGFTVICCELSLCVHRCCLTAIVGLAATCSK